MKTKWTDKDWELISTANKLNRSEWKRIDSLIEKTTNNDVKTILKSLQSTYRISHEIFDVLKITIK
jgi:hypothetical protein